MFNSATFTFLPKIIIQTLTAKYGNLHWLEMNLRYSIDNKPCGLRVFVAAWWTFIPLWNLFSYFSLAWLDNHPKTKDNITSQQPWMTWWYSVVFNHCTLIIQIQNRSSIINSLTNLTDNAHSSGDFVRVGFEDQYCQCRPIQRWSQVSKTTKLKTILNHFIHSHKYL